MTAARRVFTVLALWAAGIGAAAQFAKIATILPALQAHYGETGVASGFLVSLIAFMGIVLGVVAGLLAVRIGPRRLLLIGLFLGAAVSLSQATLPPFWLLMATRFVEGVSHLAVVVAAPTLIARFALPPYQGAALTLWGTFFGVAFFVAALAAPPLVTAFGLSGPFAAHGALMLALGALMLAILPNVAVEGAAGAAFGLRAILQRHRAIYASAHVGAPALGWMFYTVSFVSLLAVLPPFIDPALRVWAMAWMPIASIVISLTVGVFLLRHLSAVTVVVTGFAGGALCAAALLVVGADVRVCLALFACLGLVQGASFAAVPQLNPSMADRALANGGLAQTGNLGNTLGTPILIALTAMAGFQGMMAFLIVCFVVGIAIHLALAAKRRAMAQI